MIELLYALLGGFIASLLVVVYSYIAEQYRLCSEIAIEVVDYCDQIYDLLEQFHVCKDASYVRNKQLLSEEEYRAVKRKLTTLIKSSRVHARTVLVFGEGKALSDLNSLRKKFQDISMMLTSANPDNWADEGNKIFTMFDNEIEPLRAGLETSLIKEARPFPIIKRLCIRYENIIASGIFFITILILVLSS